MKLTTETKVGAFVVAVALAFAVILTFGEVPIFKEATKEYIAVFDNVAGLSKGAEVRVAGVKAGKVKDIKIKKGKVEVVFEVKKDIPIYSDAYVEIGTLGLMGDKYLSVYPGSLSAQELKPGSYITQVRGYADTDLLIREVTDAAQNLKAILEENRESVKLITNNLAVLTQNLNLMVLENRENLRSSIHNLNLLLTTLNKTLPQTIATIDKLANNLNEIAGENKEDIRAIVANLRQVSPDLKATLPELSNNLNEMSKNINNLVAGNQESIQATFNNLKESTQRLNNILASIERGEGTLGKLVKDEELYQNVTKLTKGISKVSDMAERTNLYVGFRGEIYKEGDSKGILTLKLQPDNEKYYLLEVVGDSRGRYTKEEYNGNVVIKKEFKPELTLQYARIFPLFDEKKLIVRGGLKESTGGIGADIIYNDRLTFTSDIWDFGRRDYKNVYKDLKANLQVAAEYKFKGPLYIRAGGDDLLNAKLRGPFIGAGLLFTDNDLKYLLGTMRLPLP